MVNQTDYRALAAQCRTEADGTQLDRVRERFLRSEAAWLEMAQRQERLAAQREAREAPVAAE